MGITNREYFLLFVMAYLLVGSLTPLMRRIAIATDVIDRPNSSHKPINPRRSAGPSTEVASQNVLVVKFEIKEVE